MIFEYNIKGMIFEEDLSWWGKFWEKARVFFLVPDDTGVNYLTRIIVAIVLIILGWLIIKFFGFLLKRAFKIKKGPEIDRSAKSFIVTAIKTFLWIGVALLVAGVMKFNLSTAAGVISAITVALGLALQDLIGCLFSGILLLQQKIIKTGEYVCVTNTYGSSEGFVEHVHLFFTYLRTPFGQIITIPNNSMTKATITNYSRLGKRRIDYDVGVDYDTDIELAKSVLKDIMDTDERVLSDEDKQVYVAKLDSYAVQLRFRCWTTFDNYWPVYNDLSEKILIAFRKNKIYIPSSTDIAVKQK